MFPELVHPLSYCLKKYGLYVFYLLVLAGLFVVFKKYGLKALLLTAAGFYLLTLLLAFLGQEVIIYFPDKEMRGTPAELDLPYEVVRLIPADDETLFAWFVQGEPAKPVILFCHGNASNISDPSHLEILRILHSLGLSVFVFDYRGFGQSTGSPSEAGTYLDAEAAWAHLVNGRGFKPGDIVIWGRSLGGGIASYLAWKKLDCRALVLESTFTSIPDVARRLFPFLPLEKGIRHRYPVREHVRRVDCPVLVMHSPQDETIPYSLGRKVFAAAPEPKTFVELQGGHAWGFLTSEETYRRAVQEFIFTPDGG